jgi:PPOX class probable F420-dependent enzyme
MTVTREELGNARYALVTTFRKDGRAVPTPVWVVPDGDALAIWSYVGAGKVKRIRRSPRVLIGVCDLRGKPLGDQVPGNAAILDAAGTARVRELLKKKYGLQAWLTLWASRVRRGLAGTVGIGITLDAPGSEPS